MSFAPPLKNVDAMANAEMANYGSDRQLIVTFFKEPVFLEAKSNAEGRQIYEDRDYIEIISPGGKTSTRRAVKMQDDERGPSDLTRFPRQWAAYQNQNAEVHDGLPLAQWPPLGRAHVLTLKAAKIHTVEQLSALPDSALGSIGIMDIRRYRDLAVQYLDKAKENAPVAALLAQIETMRQDMEVLKQANAELAANQKQKPGPKPRVQGEPE